MRWATRLKPLALMALRPAWSISSCHAALHGTLYRKAFAYRDFPGSSPGHGGMIWLRCSSMAVLRTEASAIFATWATAAQT